MRKLFIGITAFILTLVTLLGGCSCVPSAPLSFKNNFSGTETGTTFTNTYKEVLTYDVSYEEEYNSYVKKAESIPSELVPEYSGTYTMVFTGDLVSLPDNVTTDLETLITDSPIHMLETKLDLSVKIGAETYHDEIYTKAIFYSAGYSFAPVYSYTILKNTFIQINTDTNETLPSIRIYEYETVYNEDFYTMSKKYYNPGTQTLAETNAAIKDLDIFNLDRTKMLDIEETEEYDYTFREVIDNNQLLFAIRNVDIEVEDSVTIPTVSPTYGDETDLAVTNNTPSTISVKLSYNGGAEEGDNIAVNNISFVISGTDNVGTQQFISIQNAKGEKTPYRALPIEFAQALVDYGPSFSQMGALKYTLKSITVTE